MIAKLANVFNAKRQECLSSAGSRNKFDLKSVWRMKLNNRPKVTTAKPRRADIVR